MGAAPTSSNTPSGASTPLHRPRAERARQHVALDEAERLRRQQDRARHRHLLHASREVRRLSDRGVVHLQVAPDGAHHHLAGIEPHANVHGHTERAVHLLRVLTHALLHSQGGVARAHGVLLVRDRRAEERHDAVAHHLVDGALVVVYGLDHALQHRVEQAPRVLGIAIGQELHRALEVREQDRHVLAFALQRVLGRADPLGEMRRRVRGRRGEARRSVGRGAHGRSALWAELGGNRQLALALGTARRQRG
jgi:hypothetical protein